MTVNADGAFEFSFKRTPAVITAFGERMTLPVRNAELLDRLITADMRITAARSAAEKAGALRQAIAVFIGDDLTEKHFPAADVKTLDMDLLQAFYSFCAEAVRKKSEELIAAKYSNEDIQ